MHGRRLPDPVRGRQKRNDLFSPSCTVTFRNGLSEVCKDRVLKDVCGFTALTIEQKWSPEGGYD